jgi:hypothetical protein
MELTSNNPTIAKRKVLAGIVVTDDEDSDATFILSVSTGTKCINGERLSISGQCLNDCHAEIVSRRCLVHFLLAQMELYYAIISGGQFLLDLSLASVRLVLSFSLFYVFWCHDKFKVSAIHS